MNFLEKCSGLPLMTAMALLWTACDEQPMEVNKPITGDAPGQWYGTPNWSPTGEWIAYNYTGPEGPSVWGIWLIRPDGSDNHFETVGLEPDFSPDGKLLTFHSGEQIFVYDLATKVRTQLTFDGLNVHPRWSPNGKSIAYSGYPTGGILSLRIMNTNGQIKLETVSHNKRISLGISDWLLDFRIINSRGTTRNRESTVDLFVIDTTGTLLQQLTDSGTANDWAKVSPDGNRIVWRRWDSKYYNTNNDMAIWMMNANGSSKVRLTAGLEPDWAPDGRHIIFRKEGDYIPGEPWDDDDPKVHGSLWMMDVDTRERRQFLPPQ